MKGAIYYVAIAKVIFSNVKITCYSSSHVKMSSFRAKAHLVFHWCLYNKKLSLSPTGCVNYKTLIRNLCLLLKRFVSAEEQSRVRKINKYETTRWYAVSNFLAQDRSLI